MFQYQESLLILTAEGGDFFCKATDVCSLSIRGDTPHPTKKLFGFGQIPKVALAEAGGVRTPGPPRPATPLRATIQRWKQHFGKIHTSDRSVVTLEQRGGSPFSREMDAERRTGRRQHGPSDPEATLSDDEGYVSTCSWKEDEFATRRLVRSAMTINISDLAICTHRILLQ